MSLFSGVVALTIDEGDVVKIEKDTSNVEMKGTGINADGTLYNGCGYKAGVRMSSSGGETEDAPYCVTGYIPYSGGSIVVSGSDKEAINTGGQYLMAYDANFNWLQHCSMSSLAALGHLTYGLQEDGFYGFELTSLLAEWAGMAYFRTSIHGDVNNLSVKVKNVETLWEKPAAFTNQVPISIGTDKKIYNNGLGYKNGYRIRSGGVEAAAGDCSCTGYIPCKPGDIVRISGFDFSYEATANAINISDASFTNLGQMAMNSAYGYGTLANVSYGSCESVVEEKDGVWKWVVPPETCGVTAYIRVNGRTNADGSKMIVTINEEIEV